MSGRSERKTVLIVDDEVLVRMVGADMMTDLGFEVLEADSGEAALRIIENRPDIDLLLTDIRMPGMDGVELVDRALVLRPDLKVIYVSGYTAPHGRLDAPLLDKPFNPGELEQVVNRQLATS